MIVTDEVHLVSTSDEDELFSFAEQIGLSKHWYQRGRRPHYDLTTARMKRKAIEAGAAIVPTRLLIMNAWWNKKKDAKVKQRRG